MSNAHDLAWCAGFFDGEGFVTIQKRNTKAKSGKRYESYYLRIGVNHVRVDPLNELQRILGGTIRKQSTHTVTNNRKQRHSWQMSCAQAANALVKMMPYFRNKMEVAEVGLELQDTMSSDKKKTSDDMTTYRSLLKNQLEILNAKD